MARKVRIGIDVGGTFTDAVAIDNLTYEVIAMHKIPTTHEEGVAYGVVEIITILMEKAGISPEDVMFIAHGTTQATNALLEGDVASVGVIGMATGMDAISARKDTVIDNIELAQNKHLYCKTVFIDSKELSDNSINSAIEQLTQDGCEVIVASEAFSVDNPENEKRVVDFAHNLGRQATAGHDISQLYGLKMRTRTAVVNASLIPKMMETANMTESAVKKTKIDSELMIMRCDGGVMGIDEVRKRPILTMLSGLAAGVAGALMYEKVSDGIFFEIGGTSIDISVIKNGKVMIKYAQVGGHKTYLQSLDVRTLGVAGGSMIRIKNKKIVDVGPRSAHIAGIPYENFAEEGSLQNLTLELVSPKADDPKEYAVVVTNSGEKYSLTLAGAANLLGYVPEGDYSRGVQSSTKAAWDTLGSYLGVTAEEAARTTLDTALEKLEVVVRELMKEYELDPKFLSLVGGGGSGSVIVPPLAEKMGAKSQLAKNAPYISTIGVALAMVKEQIERSVSNPTTEDIKKIREDIIRQIVISGAQEETVDVSIEIDAQRNILRAVATGATEFRQKDLTALVLSDDKLASIAGEALNADQGTTELVYNTGRWNLFEATTVKKALFGLIKTKQNSVALLDREGVVRFKNQKTRYINFKKAERESRFNDFLDDNTVYSDANATIPKVFVFYGEKMLDLTGMHTAEQLFSILDMEIQSMNGEDEILAVAYQ